MTDKRIGPRVLCGDANPPADGYEYVRRYANDVRLAAGSGSPVENENVAGYVAFRRDWIRGQGLRAERCSLVDVTGDSMEPELFDGDSALVDHSRCDPVEGEIFALRTLEGPLVKRLRFHDERWWASSDNDSSENGSYELGPGLTERPCKHYIAFKARTNFVDVEPLRHCLRLVLNLRFADLDDPWELAEDLTGRWHRGNGDVAIRLDRPEALPYVVRLVRQAFERQASRPGVPPGHGERRTRAAISPGAVDRSRASQGPAASLRTRR